MDTEKASPTTEPPPQPDWGHRDHPTFTALTGFFTGLAFVTIVPAGWAATLQALFGFDRAEQLFPLVLVALVVPGVLLVMPRTRRFGRYMVAGMAVTLLVVLGVSTAVLWFLVTFDS